MKNQQKLTKSSSTGTPVTQ